MTRWEVTVLLPMPLPSAANLREHWATKHRRVAKQRAVTGAALRLMGAAWLREWRVMAPNPVLRVRCVLTRIGRRRLDSDNVQGAFKAVRDEVAKVVGIDDGSERWCWEYAQETGEPGVRIRLEVMQREVVR